MITPVFLGRHYLETYFLAESDRDAVKDSFRHALALVEVYSLGIVRLEVFGCQLGVLVEGVSQGGIDRMLYDSENLAESLVRDRPIFIQTAP